MKMNEDSLRAVGKRMPYRVPPSFFDRLQDQAWSEIERGLPASHSPRMPRSLAILRTVLGVAACIAVVFGVNLSLLCTPSASLADVDRAFAQLSADDQAYYLDAYSDDTFLYE